MSQRIFYKEIFNMLTDPEDIAIFMKWQIKKRGCPKALRFALNYWEYRQKVKEAGIFAFQIGRKGIGMFQLARFGDRGDYTHENCRFITQCENVRERNLHYVMSDESRAKMSASKKGQVSWNKGKPWSEEAKKKMSLTRKAYLKRIKDLSAQPTK